MPQPLAQSGDFLTIDEVHQLLGLSHSAIYTQRKRGEAPGSLGVKVGRRIMWRRSDLETWWDNQVDEQLASSK